MGLAVSSWEALCAKRDMSAAFREGGIDAAMTNEQIEDEYDVFPCGGERDRQYVLAIKLWSLPVELRQMSSFLRKLSSPPHFPFLEISKRGLGSPWAEEACCVVHCPTLIYTVFLSG
jgi:hypothetical protein